MDQEFPIPPPRWVEPGIVTDRGLDLLGLRNPVQSIVNVYLSGITTITPAIRYLSIRTLIAHAYASAKRPESWKSFREYAGKVEAAVALGNIIVNSPARGVLGSDKATEILGTHPQSVRLEDLVQQLGINIYAGASDQLGISFNNQESTSGIPGIVAERGVPLAKALQRAFEETKLGTKFLTGAAPTEATLEELTDFGNRLRLDRFETDERQLLIDILVPERPDDDSRLRVMTFALLLELASTHSRLPTEDDVIEVAIDGGPNVNQWFHDALDGWLAFVIRDQLAVAHEYVLQEINSELEVRGATLVDSAEIVGALLSHEDELSSALQDLGLITAGEAPQDLSFAEISDRVIELSSADLSNRSGLNRWDKGIDELKLIRILQSKTTRAGVLAILPVAWLLAARRLNDSGKTDSRPARLLSDQGRSRIGLEQVVIPGLAKFIDDDARFVDVAAELALRTVDQHLQISWTRFGQDPKKLVAVISSDGRNWAFRNKFYAGRTASRVSQAVGWLEQLGLVDASGITETGRNRLEGILKNTKFGGEE